VNDTVVGALLVYCFALISVGCVQTPILQCVMADHVCALMLYDMIASVINMDESVIKNYIIF